MSDKPLPKGLLATDQLDLFFEEPGDASCASDHIPEPDAHEFRVVRFVEALDIEFPEFFGGTHEICGIDGFVGGNEDEFVHTILDG